MGAEPHPAEGEGEGGPSQSSSRVSIAFNFGKPASEGWDLTTKVHSSIPVPFGGDFRRRHPAGFADAQPGEQSDGAGDDAKQPNANPICRSDAPGCNPLLALLDGGDAQFWTQRFVVWMRALAALAIPPWREFCQYLGCEPLV